jgi:hypothetical protein
MVIDNFKWDKFPLWPNFQIPLDFELEILETIQISNFLEF